MTIAATLPTPAGAGEVVAAEAGAARRSRGTTTTKGCHLGQVKNLAEAARSLSATLIHPQ